MKATDMMIGDWVYVYEALADNLVNKVAIRVEGISSGLTFVGCGGRYCDYDYAEPIPLTEEILKANGFYVKIHFVEWQDDPSWTYEHKSARVEYDEINKVVVIKSMLIPAMIKYVHELQHALRLCGLNDIADNLKVK